MKKRLRNTGSPLSQQQFLILSSLAESRKHGYAISTRISEATEGKVQFSGATLYENLSRMLDAGLIERSPEEEVQPGRLRKVYRITAKGATTLEGYLDIVSQAVSLIPNHSWN